jgi:signal transduction histidine kinase
MNATEAMQQVAIPERELLVRTEHLRDDGVRLSVSDAGVGIADVISDKVFDAFFSTKPGGMGLGLKVCSTIIEAHGGRLGGRNNPGRGATFHFEIPAARKEQA